MQLVEDVVAGGRIGGLADYVPAGKLLSNAVVDAFSGSAVRTENGGFQKLSSMLKWIGERFVLVAEVDKLLLSFDEQLRRKSHFAGVWQQGFAVANSRKLIRKVLFACNILVKVSQSYNEV